MTYKAGTKTIRLTGIEDADPFLKIGKSVMYGRKFPLREMVVTPAILRFASKYIPPHLVGGEAKQAQLANFLYLQQEPA